MANLLLIVIQEGNDSFELLLSIAVFLVAGGALGLYIYHRLRLGVGTASWNMVDARIENCFATAPVHDDTAVDFHGRPIRSFFNVNELRNRAVLQYSYAVAGEFYSGSFILGGSFASPEDARAAAKDWLGKTIFVRYHPDKPYLSVYLRADGAPKGSRSLGDQPPPSDDLITLSLK